ncbi:hypothetical protein EIP91_005607 [Steccherinum ochraceum]|uniref:Multiple myeloma tumor-associated protein 2-like N-terminal domain-containing protein n=1 Tax=Steccherinum ochraceum TaxID=92696 RepID=A0A4R0R9K3_9APHY|nr:hypothetical protein EIP91_005607 [Steccherinum ochraceum]
MHHLVPYHHGLVHVVHHYLLLLLAEYAASYFNQLLRSAADMFEPVRGGTRGGQAEFKWSDVSADKDRENYLGHSINAPTGRWQKNKDVHWYSRDQKDGEEERRAEIQRVKEAEAEAMAAALGFAPKPGASINGPSGGSVSGSNAIPVVPKTSVDVGDDLDPEKEEKKKRKAERKEEKRLKKERKEQRREDRAHRKRHDGDEDDDRQQRNRDRSRSPRRKTDSYGRSATPPVHESGSRAQADYDALDRERERERARRRWDDNARRERPGSGHWGRDR